MEEVVLISGGSGLIGRELTGLLKDKGYTVWHLSRSSGNNKGVKVIEWDIKSQSIEDFEKEKVNHIVHLAGEGIADKRWTDKQKRIIIDSRIESTNLLYNTFKETNNLKTFVSASGINYYGTKTSSQIFTEEDPPAEDFLGKVCKDWEAAADQFKKTGTRVVKLRTAMVIASHDSALQKMETPVKLGLGAPLGSGKHYMPWIHVKDMAGMYHHAIKSDWNGPYNAVAPEIINNKNFMKKLARQLNRPFFMPPVPSFLIKLVMGEMSNVVLKGSRASCQKALKEGFEFQNGKLDEALKEIYG